MVTRAVARGRFVAHIDGTLRWWGLGRKGGEGDVERSMQMIMLSCTRALVLLDSCHRLIMKSRDAAHGLMTDGCYWRLGVDRDGFVAVGLCSSIFGSIVVSYRGGICE